MKIKTLLIATLFVAFGQAAWAQTQAFDLSQGDFTEGFESGIGNWTIRNINGGILSSVSVGGAVYQVHHEVGEYCFKATRKSKEDPYGYLISPEFDGTENGIHVKFYYNAFYLEGICSFQIGIVTDIDDPSGTFQKVNEVNAVGLIATGSNPWVEYEQDLPVASYIAIRVPQGSNVFLDDFTISATACAIPSKPVAGYD